MLQRALAWLILLAHAALAVYALNRFQALCPARVDARGPRASGVLSLPLRRIVRRRPVAARALVLAVFTFVGLAYSCYAPGRWPSLPSSTSCFRLLRRPVDPAQGGPAVLHHEHPHPADRLLHLPRLVPPDAALPDPLRLVYWIALALPVVLAFRSGVFSATGVPRGSDEFGRSWPLALLWMPLLANWLLALKPEVSPEGLARHWSSPRISPHSIYGPLM